MPLNKSLKKVIILGSGPIIIGQAAEFDYSGTQACRGVSEEGIKTVLINSNPATIMTDSEVADSIYIEPLNVHTVEKIIEKEKPDGILAGFGGQTALNLAMRLKEDEILEKHNVKLLGVNEDTIKKAEDREEFKKLMLSIGEPVPMSIIATNIEECIKFAEEHGFPLIVRPAYTLGGTGGGIASDMEELIEVCSRGIMLSPINQILLEQSVAGWKELEYEVIRDKKDNCIIICNMENIDPVGIHTGDSIVVAPSQTLRDKEYQMLRTAALKIIRNLKVEGGCNIQFALDTESSKYAVIEVNPRVSRSSALASKATGYPIAKIAAKIAIGYSLDELKNYVTGNSSACFEPTLDYVVVKIPRWPFDKFGNAERTLGTQMKATGEVMAISRTFESALLKAVTSLDGKFSALKMKSLEKLSIDEIISKIKNRDDQRIFAVTEAVRKGVTIEEVHEITKIDMWFLNGIKNIVDIENKLLNEKASGENIKEAEAAGFTEEDILELTGIDKKELQKIRNDNKIYPIYKMVDTCSGEFEARTPYYYSCYDEEDESMPSQKKKVIIIGSGAIRIGQGIEFDYCCVHGVHGVKKAGYEAVMINNNPETVSTDFDIADKLYFEPLHVDDVMNIINKEKPEGVIVQLGGQTSINLAKELYNRRVTILGTSFESIDLAEDRGKFSKFLKEGNIPLPQGFAVNSVEEAYVAAEKIGYPVIVRPSYVIGGRAMEVVHDKIGLETYMREAVKLSESNNILVDKYVMGREIEVDAICDGSSILIPGIMEHIERTGIHSGDSISVYPSFTLEEKIIKKLVEYTEKISLGLKIKGLVNIQYVYNGKEVYVIEVNPRASRTVPILSKVTGVSMVQIAVNVMLGRKLKDMGLKTGLLENKEIFAVKVPVFSGEKLADADIYLGPEMKSTGEVLGIDKCFEKALYKGFEAAGTKMLKSGSVYVSVNDMEKQEACDLMKKYKSCGFEIIASKGTSEYFENNGLECKVAGIDEAPEIIAQGKIDLLINIPTRGNNREKDGFKIRRKAVEFRIPVFTCIDTAAAYLEAIKINDKELSYKALNEYVI